MLRLLLRVLVTLVVLVAVAVAVVLAHGAWLASRRIERPVAAITVAAGDTARVARGRHLAQVVCASCHGMHEQLPLIGSEADFLQVPGGPSFGSMRAPNLTPAGNLRNYPGDGLLLRAIREGIGHDGRALLIMPAQDYHGMGDDDAASLVAFLRSQPPEGEPTPLRTLSPLGLAVLGLKLFRLSDQPPLTGPVPTPQPDSSAAYGRYLARMLGCRNCHGADLRGGREGQFEPLGPDLVTLASAHPVEVFDRAVRGGISSRGLPLDPRMMPWRPYSNLDDTELAALYAYLRAGAGTPPAAR